MCFWFEGKFVLQCLFNLKKLKYVTKEMLCCSFLQVSIFHYFFPPFPPCISIVQQNASSEAIFCCFNTKTFMKLSSEANCFLFIQTSCGFFVTWLQDPYNLLIVSWSCALCILPLCSSTRFSSELCDIVFVCTFTEIFYNILLMNFGSSSACCLPAGCFRHWLVRVAVCCGQKCRVTSETEQHFVA